MMFYMGVQDLLLGSRYRAFKFWKNKTKQNLYILGPYPNTLFTFKGGGLVNLMHKRSTQSSIQGYTAWVLLAAFTQIYSENHKQTAE